MHDNPKFFIRRCYGGDDLIIICWLWYWNGRGFNVKERSGGGAGCWLVPVVADVGIVYEKQHVLEQLVGSRNQKFILFKTQPTILIYAHRGSENTIGSYHSCFTNIDNKL